MLSVAIVPESIEYAIPHLPTSLFFTLVVWLLIGVLSVVALAQKGRVPGKIRAVFEMLLEYICGLADEIVGPRAKQFYPLFVGLFIYIVVANLIGLVPGIQAPTSNPNTTFALAILVFVYFVGAGIVANGWGYFKQFRPPKMPWYMFPVSILISFTEVISYLMRPFSLGLRLFCNMFAKELFLQILALLLLQFLFGSTMIDHIMVVAPLVLRPFILILGLVIAVIQALLFAVLSMSYVAAAVNIEEH